MEGKCTASQPDDTLYVAVLSVVLLIGVISFVLLLVSVAFMVKASRMALMLKKLEVGQNQQNDLLSSISECVTVSQLENVYN